MHENSSVRCVMSGFKEGIRNYEVVKVNKSSSKVWRNFIQWSRHKIVATLRRIKSASEYKWQCDE